MKIGTKSVLFGYHCFFIHPWFVAIAWWRLYGFPWDLRLWAAFFLHDLGYFGKPNMDGPEGESHPLWAAQVMFRWFDRVGYTQQICDRIWGNKGEGYWYDFVLFHSRYYAKKHDKQFSALCVADKFAIAITPTWLALFLMRRTGEHEEYISQIEKGKYRHEFNRGKSELEWYTNVRVYCRKWVEEHKNLGPDTMTVVD